MITQTKLTLESLRRLSAASETQNLMQHHKENASADYCLVVDTHSEYKEGELIYGQNPLGDDVSDSAYCVCVPFPSRCMQLTVLQVIQRSMGWELIQTLEKSQGIRGLILLTCGTAWTKLKHYKKILSLIGK